MRKWHLVILKKPYLEAILEGRKTIESRFGLDMREPFGRVRVGDMLLLKESSGPVCAKAAAAEVKNYESLCPRQMLELKKQYNERICGDDIYWQSKMDCRFGLLVRLKDVERIEPVRIDKKDWRAWVVLQKDKDFGLLRLCR